MIKSHKCNVHQQSMYCITAVSLNSSQGDSPSPWLPAISAKLWLGGRPAPVGTASDSSAGPAPQHQPTAPDLPTIPRHHGPQPQHEQGIPSSCFYRLVLMWFVSHSLVKFYVFDTFQMDMDLKLFGSGMDVKPGTPPVSARSTTPTSSPYRYRPLTYMPTAIHQSHTRLCKCVL